MNEKLDTPEISDTETSKQSKDKFTFAVVILLVLLLVGIVSANIFGYLYGYSWVGVVNYKTGEIKTLWDWMELLLIPFVLAIGAFLFYKSEKTHDRKIAEAPATTIIFSGKIKDIEVILFNTTVVKKSFTVQIITYFIGSAISAKERALHEEFL